MISLKYGLDNFEFKALPKKENLLLGKKHSYFPSYKDYTFQVTDQVKTLDKVDKATLKYKLFGSTNIESLELNNFKKSLSAKTVFDNKSSNFDNYEFIKLDRLKKEIKLLEGNWSINEPLIFPSDFIINIQPGFSLDIKENAFIVSNSALNFNGSSDKKIKIFSQSGGKGILVLNANNKSKINHTVFEGLKNPSFNKWSVTGAVTFYQSPVDIRNTTFKNGNSEDSLNIVRSPLYIDNIYILGSKSDALDIDFSDGEIKNLFIKYSGNDGLDISGSKIYANSIFIDTSGDKALSIGENSQLEGSNFQINNAEIAITSKDLSNIDIKDVFVKNSKLGITAFQKKPEYGGAFIRIVNYRENKVRKNYLLEPNSNIFVNNEEYKSNVDLVIPFLYGKEYGKKS